MELTAALWLNAADARKIRIWADEADSQPVYDPENAFGSVSAEMSAASSRKRYCNNDKESHFYIRSR